MVIEFAGFSFDESSGTVLSGGRRIKLERRALLMLSYLIRNNDRIVGKEELIEVLWDGDQVSDSSLPRCVNALRTALGSRERDGSGIIQTIHGVGYRFVQPIREIESSTALGSEAGGERAARRERIAILQAELDVGSTPSRDEAERCLELAILETRQGLFSAARTHLLRVAVLARMCEDGSLLGRAAIAMAGTYLASHRSPLLIDLLNESIRAVGSSDLALSLELKAELEVANMEITNLGERCAAVRRNLRDSEALDDPHTSARILLLGHLAIEGPGTLRERREMSERAVKTARELQDPRMELAAHFACVSDALAAADLERMESHWAAFRRLAEELDENLWLARLGLVQSTLEFMGGRYDHAIECRDRGLGYISDSEEDHRLMLGAQAWMTARVRTEEIRHLVMPVLGVERLQHRITAISIALGMSYLGVPENGARMMDRLPRGWFDSEPRNHVWNTIVAFCAEIAFRLADRRLAWQCLDEMSRSDHVMVSMGAYICAEPLDYFLGLAETTLESWTKAEEHFRRATEICQALDARGFEATVACAWGWMLSRRGGQRRIQAARRKLSIACESARSLRMTRLEREATGLLLSLGSSRS